MPTYTTHVLAYFTRPAGYLCPSLPSKAETVKITGAIHRVELEAMKLGGSVRFAVKFVVACEGNSHYRIYILSGTRRPNIPIKMWRSLPQPRFCMTPKQGPILAWQKP